MTRGISYDEIYDDGTCSQPAVEAASSATPAELAAPPTPHAAARHASGGPSGGEAVQERPILFSGPMIRAILAGQKTMMRRVVTQANSRSPVPWLDLDWRSPERVYGMRADIIAEGFVLFVPDGGTGRRHSIYPRIQPGDRLWVRETWANHAWLHGPVYRATDPHETDYWRPSIHMPRWACRLLLDVTHVRAERLQDISEADAIAEGVEEDRFDWRDYSVREEDNEGYDYCFTARESFGTLWDSINAAPKPVRVRGRIDHYISYPWQDIQEVREHCGRPWLVRGNPWVWAVTFPRVEATA